MKTLFVVATIFCSFLMNKSYANGGFNLNEKLEKVVRFEHGILPIEKNKPEFVKVSFRINDEGMIEILEMNYSDEVIKQELFKKLSKLKVEEEHDANKIYNYSFTFRKF